MPTDSSALSIIGLKPAVTPPGTTSDSDATSGLVAPSRSSRNNNSNAPTIHKNGISNIFDGLRENPLFTGGLAIAAMGAGFQILRKGSTRAFSLARRQMLVTVEIPSSDPSYDWILHFLAEYQNIQARSLSSGGQGVGHIPGYSLSALLSRFRPAPRELAVETRTMKTASGASVADFVLVPGQGKHIINYNSTLLQIERTRDSKRMNPNGTPFETVEVTTLFSHRSVLTDMLYESQQLALCQAEGKTTIYTARGIEWQRFGSPQRKRPLSSMVLAPGVKEKVVGDLRDFLASPDWYRDRGIPYRRGYLLYGPPGTGKTSFVKAIAGELDYNICLINLSERGLTDDRLNHLLTNLPERSIALLEDVDAAFANRTQTAEDGYRGANVTFSGLLNAVDGAASGEDRIIVLTTNHQDRLDEALLRPGRVDLRVEIGYATPEVVEGMWERFYGVEAFPTAPEQTDKLRQRFLEILRNGRLFEPGCQGVSTAELQGMFLFFKNDPAGVIQAAENLVKGRVS